MRLLRQNFTPVVAVILLISAFFAAFSASAQTDAQKLELDSLFAQLKEPIDGDWKSVETRIWQVWSDSGSDAMNLLLARGRAAAQAGDYKTSIEHLTALTDHAPNFAEGWNARATTYFMMGEYALSVADIEHVLTLEPRHFGALAGMGMIFETLDQPASALKAFKAAQAVHPFRPDVIQAIKRLDKKLEGTSL